MARYPNCSALFCVITLNVGDIIPSVVVRLAGNCPLECMSIYILIKTLTSLYILRVLIDVLNSCS